LAAPRSKREFVERFDKGEFGNRPRIWANWKELRDSDYSGYVTLRPLDIGGKARYGVHVKDIVWADCDRCHFNESMPDDLLTIQGNIYLTDTELKLTYSTEAGLRHREAVTYPNGICATGLLAWSLLKVHMEGNDWEDLMLLLEMYRDAWVIEFSTYQTNVGVLPNRKTVWWEVRAY
jgi:hypothetical protein